MIKGKKHIWCGKVNWNNVETCNCSMYHHATNPMMLDKIPNIAEVLEFKDVTFDSPVMEDFAALLKRYAEKLNMNITINYISDYTETISEIEDEINPLPAVSVNGLLYVYPEKIKVEHITGEGEVDGFALDIETVEYNYPNEPDFADYDRITATTSKHIMINKILTIIWEQHLSNVAEQIAYEDDEKFAQENPF